jgi:hypothetical protein
VAVAVASAACAGSGGVSTGPRLSAAPSAFDFGNVLPQKTLHRDVALRNVGDAELVITNVFTTCDCTVVGDYARRLAPGAGTSLRIQLTTPAREGRTEQRVAIETNDPERPQVEVTVAATVVQPPKAAP